MNKKTAKHLAALIGGFLAIIFLLLAFSSPGAAAQTDVAEGRMPALSPGNKIGTSAVLSLPVNWTAKATRGPAPAAEESAAAESTGQAAAWQNIKSENFEGSWPSSGWSLYDDSNDGYDRTWGPDNYKPYNGNQSAWPAKYGADGLDPNQYYYPNNLDSWMIYGPFDLSDATQAEAWFWLWRDIEERYDDETWYDWFFIGASSDCLNFTGFYFDGYQDWTDYQFTFDDWAGLSSVCLGWYFHSDDSVVLDGPFVDDVLIRKYVAGEPAPTANFTAAPTSGTAPLNVSFTDTSTGSVTSRSWDFGDGNSSTATNPSHTYTSAGTYTVSLTVTGPGGSNTNTKTNYIQVNAAAQPPVAEFSGTPRSGAPPLNVSFTNQSTGNISSWSWDFGDGSSSTQQNPSHNYAAAGVYTVALTVTGPGGSNTNTKTNYINVANPATPPTAEFSGTPTAGPSPLQVNFTDLSTGDVSSWSWNFGDGSSSTATNPSHNYTAAGTYTVALTVTGPGGSNTNTKTGYITVTAPVPAPTANFSGTPTSGTKPLNVSFSDTSTGNITSWSWDFGDGSTSTLQNPGHLYTTAGTYTVALTVTGPGGSNTNTKTGYITVNEPAAPPVADFSGSPLAGVRPLEVQFSDKSTGQITGWSWNFGDAATSTEQNPKHTYNSAGNYTVVLTVTGPGGSDSKSQVNYVQVTNPTTTLDLVANKIEVTQGIQDLNNSVRLVANKKTFVRLHVSSNEGNHVTTARLVVRRGNNEIEIGPTNPGGTITVRPAPNRGAANDSFLFELPSSFLRDSVTLTAELNPNMSPAEMSHTNNTIETTVNFENVPTLNLVLYGIGYGNNIYPSQFHRDKLVDWMKRAYPVSIINVIHRSEYYGQSQPNCDQVNALLVTKRNADIANNIVPEGTHYYGMVDDAGGFMRGCAHLPGFVGSGPTGSPSGSWAWDTDGSYGDWYGGHELGHAYNRLHAMFCGAAGGGTYPYPNGRISPSLTGDTAIYGFDIHTKSVYTPDWSDMMTYCNNQWISDFTYEGLMTRFQNNPIVNAVDRSSAQVDRLSIVGTINPNNNQEELVPIFVLPDAHDIEPSIPGQYAIVLRDVNGNELARYPFTPDPVESGPDPAGGPEIDLLMITELVPNVEGTSQIDIEESGQVIGKVTAGPATPSVTLITPNGGETLAGDTISVAWSASDADGDPLVFNVHYSSDNGQSWETVAQFVNGSNVDIDASNISGSNQGRFRVSVSDGIHTSHDDSDGTFNIPNRIPTVEILEPTAGDAIVIGETLGLRGDAYDIDTGTMSGNQLQWFSNVDGFLGDGDQLSVAGLSEGVHTITFRADDGAGGVADATVEVSVVSSATKLPDKLLVGPGTIIFDPATSQTSAALSLANQNANNVIAWTASASDPWIQLDAGAGSTPDVVGVAYVDTGLGAGTHEGTITFTSPDVPDLSEVIRVSVTITAEGLYMPIIIGYPGQ